MVEGPLHNSNLVILRERMLRLGPNALSSNELMTLVLGTGHANKAMELSERLYSQYGGLVGIARLGLAELGDVEGVGLAKATQLHAALDLSGRLKLETVIADRPQIRTPADAAALCTLKK